MKLSLIVAVDEAFGIGYQNQLLCHLPDDLKHFKAMTMGKPILMGRKTFESIGRALPGRKNIVLSRTSFCFPGVTCFADLSDVWRTFQDEPVLMVIGGASLYRQTLPWCHEIYLTQIHHTFQADTFFPKLDKSEWDIETLGEITQDDKHLYRATFYRYTRRVCPKHNQQHL